MTSLKAAEKKTSFMASKEMTSLKAIAPKTNCLVGLETIYYSVVMDMIGCGEVVEVIA